MFEIRQVGIEYAKKLVDLYINTFIQAYEGVHSPDNINIYCETTFTLDNALYHA